ncbi:MAG: UDP-N-acetylmuramate:L-alanyl-gamma-D-glutamyl-meso-diaminopimelate ligase [Acidiferrobacterales bacterium]|nr:UDP-N-acetylmuramate:L-alanyl-gamma-D-glutamyl-meso-diaminopimelate ligase [Acidiferrobacterales bacterium]
MNIHIIGVCGTFMGGVARLARDLGHTVSGSDANTYPPMSTQLESLGIQLFEGYRDSNISDDADIIVVGNTISRGNPELEYVLEKGLAFTSGAQWLREYVLQDRWVLGVAGTHGKTTTSSILAWILEDNQLNPGYLIGGVPENFGESARLGETPFFVIEADEYDTAFSDKRSKFVHYRARTLILNNLEFDHADIFANLNAIQTQFHHLVKTIPESGLIIHNQESKAIAQTLELGCWSQTAGFGLSEGDWQSHKVSEDASKFMIAHNNQEYLAEWSLIGEHNMQNALAAIAAAHHVGIPIEHAVKSLATFKSVKRRLELLYEDDKVRVYDDFAHHPTAIEETLKAVRNKVGDQNILAVLEPRSNTMKQGVHKHLLANSLQSANNALIYADDNVSWDINSIADDKIATFNSTEELLGSIIQSIKHANSISNIIIMSNGGFENLHQRLVSQLT